MSWPGWTPTAPTLPTAVASVPSTLLPTAINSAPSVLPPTLTQYSPEQWAQAQQQNWQQWAQWQQQYQQWHQQYGAEYQKSLTAMQTAVPTAQPPLPVAATPSMAPPLPVEPKPPLPPEEPPNQPNAYSTMPPKQVGYSTAPPSLSQQVQPSLHIDPYSQREGWQNTSQKRPYCQETAYEPAKKPNLDKGFHKWGGQDPENQWQTGNQNFTQPPPPQPQATAQSKATNVEELSEAEKKFDKEFAAWEAQFNKWKDQNANHPDKVQYKEYEKKWESWRNSLLERREQMRKKRVALTANKSQQQVNYTQPPPSVNPASGPQVGEVLPPATIPLSNTANQSNFSMPPPHQNNEPLVFKNNYSNKEESNADSGFLTSTPSTGGIPGLDLVRDEVKDIEETKKTVIELDKEERSQPTGPPDFDAISKGINTILGDQKLMSMLSIVTQKPPPGPNSNVSKQGYSQGRPSLSTTEMPLGNMNVPPPAVRPFSGQQSNVQNYNDQSNQSYDDRLNQEDYHQREDVTNFDDQTRSSFTMGPTDQDQSFRNRGPPSRISGDRMANYGPGVPRNNFGPGNQRFPSDNFGMLGNKNDRYGGPRNVSENTFASKNRQDNFGRGNNFGPVLNEQDRFGPNRGNNRNDRFSNNCGDSFQNEGALYGNTRNKFENTSPLDKFNNQRGDSRNFNRSGEYNQGDDYEDFENYNEEDDYDKYHNRFLDDDQDEYQNTNYQQGHNRDFVLNQNRDIQANRNRDFQSNQNRDFPHNQNRDYQHNQNRDFQSNRNRDFHHNQNRDFQPKQNRDFQPNQNRDFQPNQNRDFQPNQNRDFQPNQNRDFQPNQNRDFQPNQKRDFQQNQSIDYQHNILPDEDPVQHKILQPSDELVEVAPPELEQPLIEDKIFEPKSVVDYDHKSLKKDEVNVTVEPVHMFDYRHTPLNRIPNSQRPEWLAECVKFIREFDSVVARMFDKPSDRAERYPGRNHSYEDVDRRSHDDHGQFERDLFDRENGRYEQDRFNREKEDRFDNDDIFEQEDKFEEESRFNRENSRNDRNYGRDEFENNDKKRGSTERDRRHSADDYNRNLEQLSTDNRNPSRIKGSFEDLSEDEMDWEAGERNKQIHSRSRSASPLLSNPPNPSATKEITTIEDIINSPGRFNRPPRIVIILRGPPGSGKTHLAKLIKDKEVEHGGSAPRILSLDDYFMVEHEKEAVEDGKIVKVKEMVYEYEAEMEESYRASFIKSFKKTITDGYFPFIIVDNVNDKVKYFGEMWSFAKQNGFQVYICQMDLDPVQCTKRNIHNRTETEIEECIAGWEPTPNHHPTIDASGFLQSNAITEVEMEIVEQKLPEGESENVEKIHEDHIGSKWDTFDCSSNNLAKLDGIHKPLRKSRTMEEYLQLEEQWQAPISSKPGQKRVRWADLEEQRQLEKMKALGFVVGHTNWDKIMDPAAAANRALKQTKYI